MAKDKKLVKTLLDAYSRGIHGLALTAEEEAHMESTSSYPNMVSPISPSTFFPSAEGLDSMMYGKQQQQTSASKKLYRGYALNELLRRHFVELTEQFLIPLNRYCGTLIPAAHSVDMRTDGGTYTLAPPALAMEPFNVRTFLKHLAEHGPPEKLRFRSHIGKTSWTDLYVRFLDSPNFLGWLRDRKALAEREMRRSYLDKLCTVDMAPAMQNERYCEFLFARMRHELELVKRNPFPSETRPGGFTLPETFDRTALLNERQLKIVGERVLKLWQCLSTTARARCKSGGYDFARVPWTRADDDYVIAV